MLWSDKKLGLIAGTLAAVGLAVSAGTSAAADAEAILSARCGACHAEEAGGLTRINAARKTPEGWFMTMVRMGIMHGLELPAAERRTLVKHLADTQGLAPSEAAPYRYMLERQPSYIEDYPPEYFYMCARCHSGARGSLQRRTKENWRLHIHFHLGQWPTTEYQFYGRDRFLSDRRHRDHRLALRELPVRVGGVGRVEGPPGRCLGRMALGGARAGARLQPRGDEYVERWR
jgi:cytochrome c553